MRWTATGSTTRNITVPAKSKTYIVINATGGTQSIVLRGAGPTTGVTIVSGEKAVCAWNGSDFVKVGGAAGGSNTQVQYNNNGVFGGITNATTDGTTLSMTSPKVTTGINDTNGAELLKVTATASAVNELTLANAAAGNAPTLSATGDDTNIGITLTPKGTGTLFTAGNVSFDGGTFVFNESGADKDFRIEGDTDANLFFTDASTDRVGIGTSSPAAKFVVASGNVLLGHNTADNYGGNVDIRYAFQTRAANVPAQLFVSDTSGSQTIDKGGAIDLGGYLADFSRAYSYARIQGLASASSGLGGYLNFLVLNTGGALTERARITSTGDFFIGNGETAASPNASVLSATGGTGTNIAGANLTIRGGASTGTGAGGVIIFSTAAAGGSSGTTTNSASERARITSGGNLDLQKNLGLGGTSATTSGTGITFPATQSASTNANTLDDYEEGTWTPTLAPGSGTFTTLTYTTNRGRYVKIGSSIQFSFEIEVNAFSVGTGSTYILLEGFPFGWGSSEAQYFNGTITLYSGCTTYAPTVVNAASSIQGNIRYPSSATTISNADPAKITAGCKLQGFIVATVA